VVALIDYKKAKWTARLNNKEWKMIKVISLVLLSISLGACMSDNAALEHKQKSGNYIDLSSDDQSAVSKEYWLVQKRENPKYPIAAAKKRVSGCVVVIVGINKDGEAEQRRIEGSYPYGVFDDSAISALDKWKWVATEKNNDHSPILTRVKLDFMVSNSKNQAEAKEQCGFVNTEQPQLVAATSNYQ
jgi:TonB family protein